MEEMLEALGKMMHELANEEKGEKFSDDMATYVSKMYEKMKAKGVPDEVIAAAMNNSGIK